jgi:TonB family protein
MKSLIIVLAWCAAVACAKADTWAIPQLTESFSVRVTLRKPGPQFRGPQIAVPTKQPLPEFPMRMRVAKITDEVVVSFTVEADGAMSGIKILKHSQKEFDEAVLEALKLWRFSPTKNGDKPVPTTLEYVIRFAMHEE